MNTPFLNTLNHQKHSHTPVWFMRQAGRYLPEYRKIREQAGSFLALCKNSDLATIVSLQPIQRFDLDAVILFSDILVVPEAMGLNLYFSDSEGPKFANPIVRELDIDNLRLINPKEDLNYVLQTIENLKTELHNIPLIGFSGSPWTLACYMLEGGNSKSFDKIKTWVYAKPQELHRLLEKISEAVTDYLCAQIMAGVDTVMLFDTWGGILSSHKYLEFSLFYINQVLEQIPAKLPNLNIPSIVFTKGGGIWLSEQNKLSCSAIGVDWTINIAKARVQTTKVLQGNLDPAILSVASLSELKKETLQVLRDYYIANNNSYSRHIFNLGHGILPNAKIDNIKYLCDLVHEFTKE